MTDKELRRLRRDELLELLIAQTKRADALQEQLEDVETQLSSRRIAIENAGSLAEAALQLSGVFQAAEQAAKLYLDNLSGQVEEPEAQQDDSPEQKDEAQSRCAALEEETKNTFTALEEETKARCAAMEEESKNNCASMEEKTKNDCAALEEETKNRCAWMEEESKNRCTAMEEKAKNDCAAMEHEAKNRCVALEEETRSRCAAIEDETKARCAAMEAETDARCEQKVFQAQEESNAYWQDLYTRLEEFYDTHKGMRQMLEGQTPPDTTP